MIYKYSSCSGLTSIEVEEGNRIYDSRNQCNAIIRTEDNLLVSGCMNTIIPNSVKSIGGYAFFGCSNLKSIVFPNGLREIGAVAFQDCEKLEKVVIPNTVEVIGNDAFCNCMSLYSVTSLINIPFNLGEWVFRYSGSNYDIDIIYMATTLYVPRGRVAMYRNVSGWQKFLNILETDTKFNLTYLVDGNEYKSYEIQATEVITPEPDPYKEGYIFSGWSTIPYLMPAEDVIVTGSFEKDPNYSSIEFLTNDKITPAAYYDLRGRRLDAPQTGMNILKMSDGTTRKVFVK